MDPAVHVGGLTKWFGREQVLKGVDLDLPWGSVTALLGRNASGKSTLTRILAGLLARDGGTARVLGRDPERLTTGDRERIAYVTDTSGVQGLTRVEDELRLVRRLRGKAWDPERERELLERFEVPTRKKIGTLSKGQQARFRLVLAMAADPQLLLLDEPALGLDLFARHDLLETIIETIERDGRAVLIASHLIDDVERVADRVAFLRQGEITYQGTIDELRDRFRRVRVTLGPAGAHALEATAEELMGLRRVTRELNDPDCERVVVCDDYSAPLVAELTERSGASALETRRMSLREIYMEVLAGASEEVKA